MIAKLLPIYHSFHSDATLNLLRKLIGNRLSAFTPHEYNQGSIFSI